MKQIRKNYLRLLYLSRRFYGFASACGLLFVFAFFFPSLNIFPRILLLLLLLLLLLDYYLLFSKSAAKIFARRIVAERLSNGDDNDVKIYIENRFPFLLDIQLIDELPYQFQQRNLSFQLKLRPGQEKVSAYMLKPVQRGEYEFGNINLFLKSPLGIVIRRINKEQPAKVAVYPSFMQMRRYSLQALAQRQTGHFTRQVRQLGHSMEFELIREYVKGDDYRAINWKASARRGALMSNHFTEEKAQQVYCVIDKGRLMKMPFEGMSLLDYAINASLVISNVALVKKDKAGLITFADKKDTIIKADNKTAQLNKLLQQLYLQQTSFLDSDFESLYINIRRHVSHRSLLILFTNFETLSGLKRQLPYLKKLAVHHLLLVVLFTNTELDKLLNEPADNIGMIYEKTIAEKFRMEKKLIVNELRRLGILSLLTSPQQLSINVLNEYIKVKARQML